MEIISPYFDSGHKWKVTEGNEPFGVTIEDNNFINRVENKEISFKKNDCLKCLIREQQIRTVSGLKKETSIIEVIEPIPSAPPPPESEQLEMPF